VCIERSRGYGNVRRLVVGGGQHEYHRRFDGLDQRLGIHHGRVDDEYEHDR
jgi:hypothetical protein